MASELVSHQTAREKKIIAKRFEVSRQASIESLNGHIAKSAKGAKALSEQLQALHERHDNLRGFWNYFKRRALRSEMGPLRVALSDVSDQLEQLRASKKAKESETDPELRNLSIAGRRRINLALIGIAQELYLHFNARGISAMAREASVRIVDDANYGGIEECRELNNQVQQLVNQLEGSNDLLGNVRSRAHYLEKHASYRGNSDLVPNGDSFVSIPVSIPVGDDLEVEKSIPVNILVDEYWDIYTVLVN
jgi:prefoldin subunit 5